MSIKIQLTSDKEKGPGYGLLKVKGMVLTDDVAFRIENNQPECPHLQTNGKWGKSPAWYSKDLIHQLEQNDSYTLYSLGPNIINPLLDNMQCMHKIVMKTSEKEIEKILKIPSDLYGSGAIIAKENNIQKNEKTSLHEETAEKDEHEDDVLKNESFFERLKKRFFIFIIIFLFVLIGLYLLLGQYFCSNSWFSTHSMCQSMEGNANKPSMVRDIATVETEIRLTLFEEAISLQKEGALEDAFLKFEKSANVENNLDAIKKVAEMYDPQFWSKTTSPFEEPNWENANYWWELAADLGDVDSLRRAAYNSLKYGHYAAEREKGLGVLKELVQKKDTEAIKMLAEVQGE